MTDLEAFAERIKQERREKSARDRRDIAQQDIAEAIRTTSATVSRWEAGLNWPNDEFLGRLADYFGVRRSWLRYGELPRVPPETERAREIPAPDPRAAKVATPPAQRVAGRKRR